MKSRDIHLGVIHKYLKSQDGMKFVGNQFEELKP